MMAQNWMLIAFIAPALWALVNIVDLFLAKEVFENETEAAGVTGVLGILPWVSVAFLGLPQVEYRVAALSVVGGILFSIYTFYYFRAIFISEDVALVTVLVNLSGLIVPLLASVVGERLTGMQYLGIAVIVVGASGVSMRGAQFGKNLKTIFWPMMIATVSVSVSMVAQEGVYRLAGFRDGLLFFSLGMFLGGVFFSAKRYIKEKKIFRPRAATSIGLILVECMNLIGVMCSQYAINVNPSVSFVAVIETTLPAFVLCFSLIAFWYCTYFGPRKYLPIIRKQLAGLGGKSFAIILVVLGIYLLG